MRLPLLGAVLWLLAEASDPLASLPPAPAGTVRFYVVRHGQAYLNLDPAPKLPPTGLDRVTELGREQARAVGRALAGRGVTLVLTSPFRRAVQTAEEIAGVLGTGPRRVERDLRSIDLGRTRAGKPLSYEDRIAEWKAGRDPTPRRGESLEHVGRRVLAVATRLARRGHRGGVVLVAHSEVIGAFLGGSQGRPGAASYPPGIRNGSISVVDVPVSGSPQVLLSDHVPEAAAVALP